MSWIYSVNSLLVFIVILLFMIAIELSVISKNMVYFQKYWEKEKEYSYDRAKKLREEVEQVNVRLQSIDNELELARLDRGQERWLKEQESKNRYDIEIEES